MTIETFLPSEVARLVLGYLAEVGCQRSHETFLSECNDLREYASLLAGGLKFSTSVGGKSLLDVLAEYCYFSRQNSAPATKGGPIIPSNPTACDSSNSAGAVYRAARQVLSLNSAPPPPSVQQPQSCPPLEVAVTPTSMELSPNPPPPKTCSTASAHTFSHRKQSQIRHKYGASASNTNNGGVPPQSPPRQSLTPTAPAEIIPAASGTGNNNKNSIDIEENNSILPPNSNLVDPLAGVDSMDPLFDFARTLAENINTVISKEENVNRNDLSYISPEKAGQIIEMTEHDPNFDRFIRSLFQGDNSLPFDTTMDGQDQTISQLKLDQQIPKPRPPEFQPLQEPHRSEICEVNAESLGGNSEQAGQISTQPTTPPPPSVSEEEQDPNSMQNDDFSHSPQIEIEQVGGGEVPGTTSSSGQTVQVKGGSRKRSNGGGSKNGQPEQKKKGRPRGRRDYSQRTRTCRVRDPFEVPPPPPEKPVDPKISEIVKTMQPLAPKLPIPRLPRHAPASVSLGPLAAPLSVLFSNQAPNPGSYYLMDTGNGNLVMVSIPQQNAPANGHLQKQNQQSTQEVAANLPTRLIISPAEEENGSEKREDVVVPRENNGEIGSSSAAPIVINDHDEQTHQMNPSGILDSVGFDDLFFNCAKSPHRFLPGNSGVFGLGSDSKLRTPPNDSQPSFFSSFATSTAIPNSACQHLVFDDPIPPPPLLPLEPSVEKPSTPPPLPLTLPSISVGNGTPKSGVSFQSTSDSQQQTGRVLRRVPLIPVPTTSTPVPAAIPPPPNPTNARRTRSTAAKEAAPGPTKSTTNNAKRRRDD